MSGLPFQFVAEFVAENDVHPGGYDVVGAFGVGGLNIRSGPGVPRLTSFDRLTGDLVWIMITSSVIKRL